MEAGRGGETTERERSEVEVDGQTLVLRWVWPNARVQRLGGSNLQIGRDQNAAIRILGNGVSRRHAELYRQGPLYVVRDLGSTNGTWLGGKAIEHAPIQLGSVMRIGEWVGIFEEQAKSGGFRELALGIWGGDALASALRDFDAGARSSLPVMIVGATGTGKERVAQATHARSGRSGAFLALNCAALPEQLAEAELFGYRRGAFTGAERASTGLLRAAHGGTLFLDELPELSLSLQAKLLRVLEDGIVTGLGDSIGARVDVRVVAASQTPLRQLVDRGRIRRDLAARLAGIELCLPPLGERRSDVGGLFSHFLKLNTGGRPPRVESRLVEALSLHHWPDNVRELETVVRRLLALHGSEPLLKRHHLPTEIARLVDEMGAGRTSPVDPRPRREYELLQVRSALAGNGGNIKAAATSLGISRQRIYRLLEGTLAAEGNTDDAGRS